MFITPNMTVFGGRGFSVGGGGGSQGYLKYATGYPLTLTKTLVKLPESVTVYGASGGVGDETDNIARVMASGSYDDGKLILSNDGITITIEKNGGKSSRAVARVYDPTPGSTITVRVHNLSQETTPWIYLYYGNTTVVLSTTHEILKYTIPSDGTGDLLIGFNTSRVKDGTYKFKVQAAVGSYDTSTMPAFEPYGYKIPILINPPILPSGYTKLASIEGTGTQFIELDFAPDGGQYKMRCKIKTTTIPTDTTYLRIFGNAGVSGCPNYRFMYHGNKKLAPVCGGATNGEISAEAWSNETVYMLEVNGIDGTYAVNGVSDVYPYKAPTVSNENNICLFTSSISMPVSAFIMYGFSVEDGSGAVIYEIIPAKRNSDGEIGMYDIVNDVFYTNQGTGSFIAGAEIPNKTINLYSDAALGVDESLTVNPKTYEATKHDDTDISALQDWTQDWKIPKSEELTVTAGSAVEPSSMEIAYYSSGKG